MFAPFNQSGTGGGNGIGGDSTVYDGGMLAGVYQAETRAANQSWQSAQNAAAAECAEAPS